MARCAKVRRANGMKQVNAWLPVEVVAAVDARARAEGRKRPGQMAVLLREALAARDGARRVERLKGCKVERLKGGRDGQDEQDLGERSGR